jgi:glutaredoxin 3
LEETAAVRCAPHALAAGPDGLCVLCRRADRPVTPPSEPPSGRFAARFLTWLLAVGMVASGAFVYRLADATDLARTTSPRAPLVSSPRGLGPPPKPASAGPSPKSLDELDPAHLLDTPLPKRAELPVTDPRPPDAAAREQQESDTRDRARRAAIQADMRARDLKAARRNVSVTMYSTTWCPACTAARSYMQEQGIAFAEHDIDRDERARQRAHRINPKRSVPTIDIDGDVIVGFSAGSLEDSIQRSAGKRAR